VHEILCLGWTRVGDKQALGEVLAFLPNIFMDIRGWSPPAPMFLQCVESGIDPGAMTGKPDGCCPQELADEAARLARKR